MKDELGAIDLEEFAKICKRELQHVMDAQDTRRALIKHHADKLRAEGKLPKYGVDYNDLKGKCGCR